MHNLPYKSGNILKSRFPESPLSELQLSLLDARDHYQSHRCYCHCCCHCPVRRQSSHPKLFGN